MTMMNSNQKNSIYENAGNYSWGGGGRDVDRVQVTDFNMLDNSMIQYIHLYFASVKHNLWEKTLFFTLYTFVPSHKYDN